MNGNTASMTVSDVINAHFAALTRAERQLAETLLDNYPVSGLGSITTVAENAGVSTPTVARMVQKLGFRGFPDFQARLHQELEATISNPIAKHDRWAASAPGTHTLNRFADAIMGNMRQTLSQIEPAEFDTAAALVADLKRKVYLVGGRITRSIADYLFTHLQVIRTGDADRRQSEFVAALRARHEGGRRPDPVRYPPLRAGDGNARPLRPQPRRRDHPFTDQWGSPVAKSSSKVFRARIEVPSAWDSSVMLLFLVEALVEAVQSSNWDETRGRMKTLEGLFDSTRIFRKPVWEGSGGLNS